MPLARKLFGGHLSNKIALRENIYIYCATFALPHISRIIFIIADVRIYRGRIEEKGLGGGEGERENIARSLLPSRR